MEKFDTFYQLFAACPSQCTRGNPVYWSVSIYLVEVSSIRLFLGILYCLYLFIHVIPPVAGSIYLTRFIIIYHNLPLILFNNGFLVSVLSSNSLVLLCFPAFLAGKGGILASISISILLIFSLVFIG